MSEVFPRKGRALLYGVHPVFPIDRGGQGSSWRKNPTGSL